MVYLNNDLRLIQRHVKKVNRIRKQTKGFTFVREGKFALEIQVNQNWLKFLQNHPNHVDAEVNPSYECKGSSLLIRRVCLGRIYYTVFTNTQLALFIDLLQKNKNKNLPRAQEQLQFY